MKIHEIFGMDIGVNSCDPHAGLVTNCLVGIEHELEGARHEDFHQSFTAWDAIQDGSLRNSGLEYVLKAPLAGSQLREAIVTLDTYIGGLEHIRRNERTSTHVHIDARDMDTAQLMTFFVLYITFEQSFFALCEESRTENNFCVPIRKNAGAISRLSALAKQPNSRDVVRNLANSTYRYAALNMASLARFGSLEFRMRESLTDATSLLEWINMLLSMKDFAMLHGNAPIQENLARMQEMEHTTLASFIFGNELAATLQPTAADVGEGLALAQHIFHDKDASLQAVAAHCTLTDPSTDSITRLAEALGDDAVRCYERIEEDPDPYYTYPELDVSTMTFRLQSGAGRWWAENIKKARKITNLLVSYEELETMVATLSKDSVRERTGVTIEDLLDSSSRRNYRRAKRASQGSPIHAVWGSQYQHGPAVEASIPTPSTSSEN